MGRDFEAGARLGSVRGAVARSRAQRAVRQPAHRGQPAVLLPDHRPHVRPQGHLARVVASLDGRGGSPLDRPARLHDRHPRRSIRRLLEDGRMSQMSGGQVPEPDSAVDGFVYVALQELATRIAHRNTGKALQRAPRRPPGGGGRLRRHQPRRRRRELPLPVLPRPHLGSARDRSVARRCRRSSARCASSRCPAPASLASSGTPQAIAHGRPVQPAAAPRPDPRAGRAEVVEDRVAAGSHRRGRDRPRRAASARSSASATPPGAWPSGPARPPRQAKSTLVPDCARPSHRRPDFDPAPLSAGHRSIAPSIRSRIRSACPQWRAYSSIMCTSIHRMFGWYPRNERPLAS